MVTPEYREQGNKGPREQEPLDAGLKTEFWDEVRRSLGGRSRRSRSCAGDGESGMGGVLHRFDYSGLGWAIWPQEIAI